MSSTSAIALSDKLHLALLQKTDAPALFALIEANRLYLRQWLPWLDETTSLADCEAFIALTRQESAAVIAYTFAIKLDGKLIGICSLDAIDGKSGRAKIGYWLAEEHTGQGIMTRCVRQLCNLAFHQLHLRQLHINCAEGNRKSRALAGRLGFRLRYKIPRAEDLYGEWVDHLRYIMCAEDWPREA